MFRRFLYTLCLLLLSTNIQANDIDISSFSPKKNWVYKEVADITSVPLKRDDY